MVRSSIYPLDGRALGFSPLRFYQKTGEVDLQILDHPDVGDGSSMTAREDNEYLSNHDAVTPEEIHITAQTEKTGTSPVAFGLFLTLVDNHAVAFRVS